ncbi:hypothetical protein ISN44_As07g028890 [Arabidopsis suecica]|uniref:Transmembrane protein n=1 Tax=Arabidopsis suecica TaxID=45249 RepID=A0A8T2C5K7_ARASU|nr:hypothetical protein ISN44_As07g028890 [Arabidopsis suecica]
MLNPVLVVKILLGCDDGTSRRVFMACSAVLSRVRFVFIVSLGWSLSWVCFSCLVVFNLGWFQSLACSSFEKQLLCWPFLDGSCVRLRRMVQILWLTISGSLLLVIARFDGMVLVGSLVLLGFVDSFSPSLRWSLL